MASHNIRFKDGVVGIIFIVKSMKQLFDRQQMLLLPQALLLLDTNTVGLNLIIFQNSLYS